MKAGRLIRLYPRAWRERYGEEFLSIAGPGNLSTQQVIDLVSGAIDAWLSAEVRSAIRVAGPGRTPGGTMTLRSIICSGNGARYTTRDGFIGAGVMLAGTLGFVALGTALHQAGWAEAAEMVMNLGFLAAMAISMPFWLTKGQPWKAQAVLVGGMTAFLVVIAWLSTII